MAPIQGSLAAALRGSPGPHHYCTGKERKKEPCPPLGVDFGIIRVLPTAAAVLNYSRKQAGSDLFTDSSPLASTMHSS